MINFNLFFCGHGIVIKSFFLLLFITYYSGLTSQITLDNELEKEKILSFLSQDSLIIEFRENEYKYSEWSKNNTYNLKAVKDFVRSSLFIADPCVTINENNSLKRPTINENSQKHLTFLCKQKLLKEEINTKHKKRLSILSDSEITQLLYGR